MFAVVFRARDFGKNLYDQFKTEKDKVLQREFKIRDLEKELKAIEAL